MKNQVVNRKIVVPIVTVVLLICGLQNSIYAKVCQVGDVLVPGESCTYPDTDAKFSVLDNGKAKWNIPALQGVLGQLINKVSVDDSLNVSTTFNGKPYNFAASKRADGNWEIEVVGNDGQQPDQPKQPEGTLGGGTPTLNVSTLHPLTEATLHKSVITLTLSGGTYARSIFDIRDAVSVSGIAGVTIPWNQPKRQSDTQITIELEFNDNISTNAALTFTVGADAIANYNGPPLTAEVPVTAMQESLTASTVSPLTGITLDGGVVTLTLSGRNYARSIFDIRDAVSVSGIAGVTIPWNQPKRQSDTQITVKFEFDGNINTDSSLTFIVGPDAIANYNGPALTAQIPVSASTEIPEQLKDTGGPQQPVEPKPSEVPKKDSDQDYIKGPWLWMIVPTDPAGGNGISTEIDSLAGASGGAITEAYVAQNGVSEGDPVGQLRWTGREIHWSGHRCHKYNVKRTPNVLVTLLTLGFVDDECIDPTVCWADNIGNVVGTLGMGTEVNAEARTAYALINLISPSEQRGVILTAQSGDAIKIWLNGKVVHKEAADISDCRKIHVPLACDPEVCVSDPALQESNVSNIHVTLKAGNNLLLVKIRQHGEYWDMGVGLTGDFTTSISKAGTLTPPSQIPTEAVPVSNTTLSISPSSVASPTVGEQVTLSLNIASGKDVAGYQATVQFDATALRYVSSANGNFLPVDAFFVPPVVDRNFVKLAATSLAEESDGNGTLATLTFKVVAVKASTLMLSDALLSNSEGESSRPQVESAQITEPIRLKGDVNGDGTVNIQDLVLTASNLGQIGQNPADVNGDGSVNIQDLVLVAGALGTSAAAPSLHPGAWQMLTTTDIQLWLTQAQHLNVTDATSQRGVLFLQQLLAVLIPKETSLLANYPNPFNPETWMPYQLARDADVTLTIYAVNGRVVRRLALGHQPAGVYQAHSRAAYWDGKNKFGEPVASGVYFYTLTAGDFTATRKMLIMK